MWTSMTRPRSSRARSSHTVSSSSLACAPAVPDRRTPAARRSRGSRHERVAHQWASGTCRRRTQLPEHGTRVTDGVTQGVRYANGTADRGPDAAHDGAFRLHGIRAFAWCRSSAARSVARTTRRLRDRVELAAQHRGMGSRRMRRTRPTHTSNVRVESSAIAHPRGPHCVEARQRRYRRPTRVVALRSTYPYSNPFGPSSSAITPSRNSHVWPSST